MSGCRKPCTIDVQPWFKDHFVGNKIVLAAVETMLVLADHCKNAYPQANIGIMEDVRFMKFLEIPPEAATVQALVECGPICSERISARLLSHMQFTKMARIKEHGEVFFPLKRTLPSLPDTNPAPPAVPKAKIDVERLYREMVPFGPGYHTLQDTLFLTDSLAWGKLQPPQLPFSHPVQEVIGSPFPLDGAMHAACVLGQQSVNFVPFPVGFTRRVICRPTLPGKTCLTRVTMTAQQRDELVFDIDIFNAGGQLHESVTGLRMRDTGKVPRINLV